MEPNLAMPIGKITKVLESIIEKYEIKNESDLEAIVTAIAILKIWDEETDLMYFLTNGGVDDGK